MEWAAGIIGWLGTAIGSYLLGLRGFLYRERFNEKRQKRDQLREFLAHTAPEMWAFLTKKDLTIYDSMIGSYGFLDKRQVKAIELRREATKYIPFFPNDEAIQEAIKRMAKTMDSFVSNEISIKSKLAFKKDREFLHTCLRKLESEVTGEGKRPIWKIWQR